MLALGYPARFGLQVSMAHLAGSRLAVGEDLARYAFVISEHSDEVVVLDTESQSIGARLSLSAVPRQIFVLEEARKLAAALGDANAIEFVDFGGGRGGMIELSHAADIMQYRPEASLLAVAGVAAGELTLIELDERRERRRLGGLSHPTSMIFGGGGHLLVANGATSEITIVDIVDGGVDRLDVVAEGHPRLEPAGVAHLARTPNGWLGFALPRADVAPILMIDLQHPRLANSLTRGTGPSRSFPMPNNSFLIVPNNGDETISLHAMASRTEVARLPGASDMVGVAMGWFDTTAFVSSAGSSSMLVLDLVNRLIAGAIPTPGRPGVGASTPNGLHLYVPLIDSDRVAVIDTRERALAGVISGVGPRPWAIQIAGPLAYCH